MEFVCNPDNLKDELKLLINLFNTKNIKLIEFNSSISDGKYNVTITILSRIKKNYKYSYKINNNNLKQFTQRYAKISLYKALSKHLHSTLSWGSLTGIRPTKIYKEIVNQIKLDNPNLSTSQVLNNAKLQLQKKYFVKPNKAEILKQIYITQNEYVGNDKLVHLYINIPFCPTRCEYCSFVACGIDKFKHLIEPYLNALYKEIDSTLQFLKDNNYIVSTIYIGGGTPTSLTHLELDELLSHLDSLNVTEFTVEAGRPDTITLEKLQVLKKHNVTRISINPQSFSNNTLKSIGRNHTSEQIIESFNLAKPFNFNINMDLIAGLSNEKFKDFKNSLNKCLSLNPTDITVHTLSIKNTSNLKLFGGKKSSPKVVTKMVNYAYKKLTKYGYNPYYLYRQKNMLGNNENIGYTKNLSCIFNVISMEELASVVACGANAISKKYTLETNRIDRFACVKNINEYINRVQELTNKKIDLFKN